MLEHILRAVFRVIGILRFQPQAAKSFENTPSSVWFSFIAAVLGLPLYALNVGRSLNDLVPDGPHGTLICMLLIYQVIEWLLWPNLMVGISKWLGRDAYYCRYIAAYNWFTFGLMLVFLPFQASLGKQSSGGELVLVGGVVLIMSGIYQWFIAVHALETDGRKAFGLVMMNMLSKMVLGVVMMKHLG